ncbi:MAG: tetratricopeptide repeat protein [Sulfuricaulis sp.]|uniref:tetratricopeptide repeat protein n=1 Tax=Sulfuricaulis sp. TaxID=2003553 RepID=UPI003C6049DD
MTRHSFAGVLFVIAASIAGCAGLPTREAESLPVSDNNAVIALADAGRADAANGKLDAAAESFERALRIEPRNPALWHELAKLRLQQGQYQQAEGLAARSNGWAGDNKTLRAENWRIIGQARLKRGDYPGAQSAFDKAAEQAN